MKIRVTTKRPDIYRCKNCGHKVEMPHHLLFDAAAGPWGRFCFTAHAIKHHSDHLPRKARLEAPLWLFILPMCTVACWALDVLHATLWAVTWPFWWLHEKVL